MKKIFNQVIIVFVIGFSILAFLYYLEFINYYFFQASLYAGFLNLANTGLAFLFFEKSYQKDNKKFLLYNLGGMIGRMFILLLSVIIFIKFLNIDKYGFILVFFIFYFVLLTIEINHFRKRVETRKEANKVTD